MPLTMQGNGGGRDVMDPRDAAAQNMLSRMNGNPAAQQAAPGGAAPQTSVGSLLAQALQLTLQSPNPEEALLPWKQAYMTLAQIGGEQGSPAGAGPAMLPGGPSGMQQMAAQSLPQMGRPPR